MKINTCSRITLPAIAFLLSLACLAAQAQGNYAGYTPCLSGSSCNSSFDLGGGVTYYQADPDTVERVAEFVASATEFFSPPGRSALADSEFFYVCPFFGTTQEYTDNYYDCDQYNGAGAKIGTEPFNRDQRPSIPVLVPKPPEIRIIWEQVSCRQGCQHYIGSWELPWVIHSMNAPPYGATTFDVDYQYGNGSWGGWVDATDENCKPICPPQGNVSLRARLDTSFGWTDFSTTIGYATGTCSGAPLDSYDPGMSFPEIRSDRRGNTADEPPRDVVGPQALFVGTTSLDPPYWMVPNYVVIEQEIQTQGMAYVWVVLDVPYDSTLSPGTAGWNYQRAIMVAAQNNVIAAIRNALVVGGNLTWDLQLSEVTYGPFFGVALNKEGLHALAAHNSVDGFYGIVFVGDELP